MLKGWFIWPSHWCGSHSLLWRAASGNVALPSHLPRARGGTFYSRILVIFMNLVGEYVPVRRPRGRYKTEAAGGLLLSYRHWTR